jgi:4-amino-4-deoxy-L-arabinose transferase-like glycosyltransferase
VNVLDHTFWEKPRTAVIFLAVCCVFLTLLWFPGLKYPIVSDSALYGLLGRSLWEHGTYQLFSEAYAKHLPLYSFFTYPFTYVFGFHAGVHMASLVSGYAVLVAAFVVVRRVFGLWLAYTTVAAVVLHPGFVLMTMLGSADLLFTALALFSLWIYLCAEEKPQLYIVCGVCAGLACLTRYNGAPLFLFFTMWTLWKRPQHRASAWFWSGMALGLTIFGVWFTRNYLVFGDMFHTEYTGELQTNSKGILVQFFSNILYYLNPIHNIFPFLFPFALLGLWNHGRRYPFILLAILSLWLLTAVWWVQAIRFAFPAYPLVLAFALLGIRDIVQCFPKRAWLVLSVLCGVFAATQAFSFCVYTYGACNAGADRILSVLPKNMHLTSEGLYSWHLAREWVNAHAESGSVVYDYDRLNEKTWNEGGVFRPDMHVTSSAEACPAYWLTQRRAGTGQTVVFETADEPVTRVILRSCGILE